MMMGGLFGGWGFIWMILVFVFIIAIIVGIILLIAWLVKRTNYSGENHTRGNALDILKQRYARGEITRDDFETMKKDIS